MLDPVVHNDGPYVMAADCGCTFIKICLYDSELNCTAEHSSPVQADPALPGETDAEVYFGDFLAAIGALMEKYRIDKREVAAVGISGQMAGCMGIDEHFNASTLWTNSLDMRHQEVLGELPGEYHERVLPVSGTATAFLLPKMLWIKKRFPEQYKRTVKFVLLNHFVGARLCGLNASDAYIDRTTMTWTGLADIANDCWSEELLALAGVDESVLPRLVPCDKIVGGIAPDIAERCGLMQGTPVVCGMGDKIASVTGIGIVEEGQMMDEMSTVGSICACANAYVPDTAHRMLECLPAAQSGKYYMTVYLSGSGASLEWYVQNFAGVGKDGGRAGQEGFGILEDAAKDIPAGCDGLMALGTMQGRALPNMPNLRGLFMGFSYQHKPAHFYKALMESFSYEIAIAVGILKELYPDVDFGDIVSAGGGARSALYNQIKADVVGHAYQKLESPGATSLGIAMLAGRAVGIWSESLPELSRKVVKYSEKYVPNIENHKIYRGLTDLYQQMIGAVDPIFYELREINKKEGER